MKKFLTVILMMALVINTTVTGNAEQMSFNDINDHWARETIIEWKQMNLTNGYPDGTFRPNGSITRSEFIALVNRIYGYYVKDEVNYSDVNGSEWFANDTAIAKKSGYMSWYNEDQLYPLQDITRQEVSAILATIMELNIDELSALDDFTDGETIAEWSKPYMSAIVKDGYMKGYPDKTLRPTGNITRAEALVMLNRVMGLLIKDEGTYGSIIGTETIDTNVTVNVANTTLKNMDIKGDFILAAGIGDGDIELNNVTVEGRTIINGGGENSIKINSSIMGEVIVLRIGGKIRIVSVDSEIGKLAQESPGKLEGDFEGAEVVVLTDELVIDGDFTDIIIEAAVDIEVTGDTKVDNLVVKEGGEGTNVSTEEGTSIGNLTFNGGGTVTGSGVVADINGTGEANIGDDIKDEEQPNNPPSTRPRKSSAKDIVATTIGEIEDDKVIDIPINTTVGELKAGLTISDKATFKIVDDLELEMNDNVFIHNSFVIVVTAEDSSTKSYTVETIGIPITTAEELDNIRNDDLSGYYVLMNDIDLLPYIQANYDTDPALDGIQGGWIPIGSMDYFGGTFDGNGYQISNLTMNTTDSAIKVGLFGTIDEFGEVLDLTLSDVNITAVNGAGLAYENLGIIDNCHVSGELYFYTDYESVGAGFISSNEGLVFNSSSNAMIESIRDSSVRANGVFNVLAGFIGINRSTGLISNCFSYGNVVAEEYIIVAGFLGANDDGIIYDSHSYVNVTNNIDDFEVFYNTYVDSGNEAIIMVSSLSGFVGSSFTFDYTQTQASIVNCTAQSSISGSAFSIGGFGGLVDSEISNCYYEGAINPNSAQFIGGFCAALAGLNRVGTGHVENSYAKATFSNNIETQDSGTFIGGFTSYNEVQITSSYGYSNYNTLPLIGAGNPIESNIILTSTINEEDIINGIAQITIEGVNWIDDINTTNCDEIKHSIINSITGSATWTDIISNTTINDIDIINGQIIINLPEESDYLILENETIGISIPVIAITELRDVIEANSTVDYNDPLSHGDYKFTIEVINSNNGSSITNFSNTAVTDSTATFTWTEAVGATEVKIEQSPAGTNTWVDAATGTIAANATTATVTGLTPNTDYDFRLVVIGGESSGNSNVVNTTTNSINISAFSNTGVTETTATFTWTAAVGATEVRIQHSLPGSDIWEDATTGIIASDATNAIVTGLTPGTRYVFRLVVSGGQNAGNSNVVYRTTVSRKITDFRCTEFTDTTATFTWTAALGATDVKILGLPELWDATTGIIAINATTATVTGLQQGDYEFLLYVTGGQNAGYSNVVDVYTFSDGNPNSYMVTNVGPFHDGIYLRGRAGYEVDGKPAYVHNLFPSKYIQWNEDLMRWEILEPGLVVAYAYNDANNPNLVPQDGWFWNIDNLLSNISVIAQN